MAFSDNYFKIRKYLIFIEQMKFVIENIPFVCHCIRRILSSIYVLGKIFILVNMRIKYYSRQSPFSSILQSRWLFYVRYSIPPPHLVNQSNQNSKGFTNMMNFNFNYLWKSIIFFWIYRENSVFTKTIRFSYWFEAQFTLLQFVL